jgi:hypothetical protein
VWGLGGERMVLLLSDVAMAALHEHASPGATHASETAVSPPSGPELGAEP